MLRCLSAEIWAIMSKNWENWDITKSCWLEPSIQIYNKKFATKSIYWKIMVFKKKQSKTTMNMSWNWPNWEQLRALAYNLNLYHLYTVTQHNKVLVSATIKKIRFFQWFLKILNFADVLLRENQDLVDRISFLVTGNNTQLVWNRVVCRFWCSTK